MGTLKVRGIGKVTAEPDYVEIYLTLTARNKDYGAATDEIADKSGLLEKAVKAAGFPKKALETLSFSVNTEYESVQDEKGIYQRVFAGYTCYSRSVLGFRFTGERLMKALSAVTSDGISPELNVTFKVEDPSAVKERLLAAAVANAREKAAIICREAGVSMGEIRNIDYQFGNSDMVSETRFETDEAAMPMLAMGSAKMRSMNFAPRSIEMTDSITVEWETEQGGL